MAARASKAAAAGSATARASPEDVLVALRATQEGQAPVKNSSGPVRVLIPEEMAELDFCKWNGDGHFDMSMYTHRAPPSLGQVVSYVRLVEAASSEAAAVLHLSSEAHRACGAVLAGAVLVLLRRASAAAAWAEIRKAVPEPDVDPAKAWDHFPPPFSTSGLTTAYSCTVLDCLAGLEAARDLGWLDYTTFDVEEFSLLRRKFDASWIIPGEVLALADPAGTARNPAFPGLLRVDEEKERLVLSPSSGSVSTLSTMASAHDLLERQNRALGDILSCFDSEDIPSENSTPNGSFTKAPVEVSELERIKDDTFASYLGRKGVGRVTRLNYHSESPPGLGDYRLVFETAGITCASFEFTDGQAPPKNVVDSFLADCAHWKEDAACSSSGSAVAVHCKAGLGRTGAIVGAYAVSHHNIDGKAFHGWMRLCRPGSVQTVVQERFLRTFVRPQEKRGLFRLPACFRSPVVRL